MIIIHNTNHLLCTESTPPKIIKPLYFCHNNFNPVITNRKPISVVLMKDALGHQCNELPEYL